MRNTQMSEEHTEQHRKKRVPWIRIVLVLIYLGLGVALSVYEANAHKILSKGQHAETSQRYQTAGLAYMMVIEKFPLSFAVVEAKTGLDRVEPALQEGSLPDRLNISHIERTFGEEFNPYFLDWLPFLASFACGGMLILIFLTRIRRGGMAFFVFLLICATGFSAAVQLARYGWIDQPELGKLAGRAFAAPQAVYIGAYALIGITILLTLSRIRGSASPEASAVAQDGEQPLQQHRPKPAPSVSRGPTAPAARFPEEVPSAAHSDIEVRLRRLQELRDQGLVSESEMEQRRNTILSEL